MTHRRISHAGGCLVVGALIIIGALAVPLIIVLVIVASPYICGVGALLFAAFAIATGIIGALTR